MSFRPGIFIWNVRADYTEGRIAIDDSAGAMGTALLKGNDGLEYQPYSPEDMATWANGVYRPQGIDLYVWGVARGWSLAVAREEGQLAGRYAALTERPYVLDLEPYPEDYWQGISGTPRAFCEGYVQTGNGQPLHLCPDARNPGINLEEWAAEPIVDIWYPQAYYTAFHQSLETGIAVACSPIEALGVPRGQIIPVLPLWIDAPGEPSISADDAERDVLYLHEQGYAGACHWRRGLMSGRHVERFLAMPDPWASTPPLPPPTDPLLKIRLEPVGAPTYHFTDDPAIREQRQKIRIVQDA